MLSLPSLLALAVLTSMSGNKIIAALESSSIRLKLSLNLSHRPSNDKLS